MLLLDSPAQGAAGPASQRGARHEAVIHIMTPEDIHRRLAEKICKERVPYYELNQGVPFSDFLVSFEAAIDPELEYLDNQAIHRLLYYATGPEARRRLGAANVPQRHTRLNAQEYYNLVQ